LPGDWGLHNRRRGDPAFVYGDHLLRLAGFGGLLLGLVQRLFFFRCTTGKAGHNQRNRKNRGQQ
jgi:hypothetical protein